MSEGIKISKTNGDQYLIVNGPYSRRYRNLEQILEELYNGDETDLSEVVQNLERIEKRIECIENFCNSLADSIAPLESFR